VEDWNTVWINWVPLAHQRLPRRWQVVASDLRQAEVKAEINGRLGRYTW